MDERLSEIEDVTMTPEERAYAAKEVQVFLRHAGLQLAFRATEARITREWTVANNPLAREMCWHKLQAFKMLTHELRVLRDRPAPEE